MQRKAGDPARRRRAVTVQERDQVAGKSSQAGVPGGRRAAADPPTMQLGAVPRRDRGDRGRVGRTIVDNYDRVQAADRGQATVQQLGAVTDRDDHGDVRPGMLFVVRRGYGVGHAGIGEPTRKQGSCARADRAGLRSSASAAWPAGVSRITLAGDPPNNAPSLSCLVPGSSSTRKPRGSGGVVTAPPSRRRPQLGALS